MVVAHITEGTSERMTFALLIDGLPINGSGLTLSNLYVTDRHGRPVDTSGHYGWVDSAKGTVYYAPAAGDLKAADSPYKIRFEGKAQGNTVAFHPSGEADTLVVSPLR